MRKECVEHLVNEMTANRDIIVVTADLGFGVLDPVKNDFPEQFYNVGAAEQLMIGVAVGLAEEGKIPVCYSMSSFIDRKSTRLNSSHMSESRMPSSA